MAERCHWQRPDLVARPGRLIAHLAEKMLMALQTTAARYCAASKPFRVRF
jgi:hypothetical protein